MISIRINKAGEVIAVRYNVMRLKDGEIAVDEIPDAPKVGQYETATMVFVGGKIGYRIDVLPEPIPEEPPPPTEEELAVARRLAYEAEADRYLIAMHGYEVEGKSEEAENCRKAYLAKKAEIRKRFS